MRYVWIDLLDDVQKLKPNASVYDFFDMIMKNFKMCEKMAYQPFDESSKESTHNSVVIALTKLFHFINRSEMEEVSNNWKPNIKISFNQ